RRVAECLEKAVVRGKGNEVVESDELRRAQEVPLCEADRQRRENRPGGQDGESDDRRGEEEQCPAPLAAERAAAATPCPAAADRRHRVPDRPERRLTDPRGSSSALAGPCRSP